MFNFCPFTDKEWVARNGMPEVKGKKKRSELGQGTFAITYRVVGRAGVEESGVDDGQACSLRNHPLPNHVAQCLYRTGARRQRPDQSKCCYSFVAITGN